MSEREPVTTATVAAVAAQNAGHPLDAERAAGIAEALEPILKLIASLRELPLKDIEPAAVFRPEQVDHND